MRWLLIGDGVSVHVQRIATGLASAGLDVHLATFGAGAKCGVPKHELTAPPYARDLRYPFVVRQIRRIVRSIRPDVVNGHYVTSYGFLAAASGAPLIVQSAWGSDLLHTASRPGFRHLTKWTLSRSKLITGDSQDVLDAASSLAPAVPVHRFVFGPPASTWRHTEQREPIVVSVRNHEPLYQLDLILRAWSQVRAQLPHHRLVILGSGSLTGELRSLLPWDAHLTGSIPHTEVLEYLRRADVAVSIPTRDATSAAVLEALASGCAVVASDLPANREWIAPEHLVPSSTTPEQLADAIVAASGSSASLDPRWAFEAQITHLVHRVRSISSTSST